MEDVCGIEAPYTPVKSCRDFPQGGLEYVLGGRAENASDCYSNEMVRVDGAFINCDLNLRNNRNKARRQGYTESIVRLHSQY